MSSFFTLPASAKKRKRTDETAATAASTKPPRPSTSGARGQSSAKATRKPRDESISGSDSEDLGSPQDASEGESDASSGYEGETGAERRLRLAERYLQNVRSEVQQVGFDAEEVDRDLIAERLKEDVAESKGRMYRFVAGTYDYVHSSSASFRGSSDSVTGVALCPPYAYTVSKDMQLVKWELPTPSSRKQGRATTAMRPPSRQRPMKLISVQGSRRPTATSSKQKQPAKQQHHTAPILCVAASPDGRFVATGGQDKKLIMWSATDLTSLRVFSQHRDSVTALSIERGLNRLYSASYDRTIKTWGLNERAYVETLFGHQDHIVDIAALPQERCFSAGARDRTVRLWKVVDETQMVFRGGGSGGGEKSKSSKSRGYAEGSIERVAMIDDETFVTGSDNGSLSLWSIHKKKPIFTYPCAHGMDPALKPEEAFADIELEDRKAPAPPQPRWITALATVPYSDIIVSGSWDGAVRAWRVTEDKKRIEPAGAVGSEAAPATDQPLVNGDMPVNGIGAPGGEAEDQAASARGVVNDLAVYERGERGGEGLCIVAALGRTHRLGRWLKVPGGKNGAVVFEIPPSFTSKRKKRKAKKGDRAGEHGVDDERDIEM
jgi:ribosomal RNA-processing protein 9